MRMKFNKTGQLLLVATAALLLSASISACWYTFTVDFIFVTSNKAAGPSQYGEIDVLEVDSQTASLRPIPTSPFFSQGRNPVAEVASHDNLFLYVINQDDNSVVQFLIGIDGKLYAQSTANTPGIFPVGIGIDPQDKYLYIIDTYQPLPTCSPVSPCAGALTIFPILTASQVSGQTPVESLGPAVINTATGLNYFPIALGSDIVSPKNISVLPNGNNVYVTAQDSTTGLGFVYGFSFNYTTTGNQTYATPTETVTPAGTLPAGITSSPNNAQVFVADSVNLANAPGGNNIFVYDVNPNGSLTLSATYPAGNAPSALAIDPTGTYLYVTNSVDSNVMVYSVSGTSLNNLGAYATGNQPVAVMVEPRLGQYVYVANFLGNSVSGFELDSANNTLVNAINTPFKTDVQPTALAAIPHDGQTR